MQLDRDGLKAHKSWFFMPSGVVCLGAGINKELASEQTVATTIEQCHRNGPVIVFDRDGMRVMPHGNHGLY